MHLIHMEDVKQYFGFMFNERSCPCRSASRINYSEIEEDMDTYSAFYCFVAGVCVYKIDFLFQTGICSLCI